MEAKIGVELRSLAELDVEDVTGEGGSSNVHINISTCLLHHPIECHATLYNEECMGTLVGGGAYEVDIVTCLEM